LIVHFLYVRGTKSALELGRFIWFFEIPSMVGFYALWPIEDAFVSTSDIPEEEF